MTEEQITSLIIIAILVLPVLTVLIWQTVASRIKKWKRKNTPVVIDDLRQAYEATNASLSVYLKSYDEYVREASRHKRGGKDEQAKKFLVMAKNLDSNIEQLRNTLEYLKIRIRDFGINEKMKFVNTVIQKLDKNSVMYTFNAEDRIIEQQSIMQATNEVMGSEGYNIDEEYENLHTHADGFRGDITPETDLNSPAKRGF